VAAVAVFEENRYVRDSPMEFRILGPLEIRANGASLPPGGPRQRALLALLLLNANRVVSRDRLADELTSDERPELRDHALRVQVSRLRKALGAGKSRVVTQAPGYLIRVAPGELDFQRFEELLAEGRGAAGDGDFESAAQLLREAGSLWRGRPLADLEFEPFARLEIERLEELRLGAIEERVDVELALGRHASLVPELEALVAEHPLRERSRAQLMLALYRSGRQAEALSAYRAAREHLVADLGLEPGPELRALEEAILRHDGALAAPQGAKAAVVVAPPPPPPPETGHDHGAWDDPGPSRSGRRWWALAALAGVAALGVAAAAALVQGRGGPSAPIEGNGLVLASTRTGSPVDSVPLAAQPTQVSAGFGSVWVTHFDTDDVSRVDLRSRTVRQTIRVGDGPSGVAARGGAVWVANTLDGTVSRIEPDTQTVVKTIAVGTQPSAVVVADGSVWVANRGDGTVSRMDARTGRVTKLLVVGEGPTALAASSGSIWVANHDAGSVSRIDTRAQRVVQTTHVGDAPSAIAVTRDAVWVADSLDSTVSKLDPGRNVVASTIPIRGSPSGLAAAEGAVWITDEDDGTLSRMDLGSGAVTRESSLASQAGPLTVAEGRLWVGARAGGASHRGGTLTVLNAVAPVRSADPAIVGGEWSPASLLGMTNDGLVTLNHADGPEGARLVPDLALSLPLPSDGGHTYVFRMRPGISYSTGAPVRPTDVRHSLERLFEMRSPGMPYYDRIVGAVACRRQVRCDLSEGIVTDDRQRTVTFHLTDPDPSFLFKLSIPFAFVVPASSPRHEARSPLPATGPYTLRFDAPGRTFVLTRNPRFRVWSQAAQPDGYADRIVLNSGLAPGRAATLVERQRADVMINLGPPPHGHLERLRTRFPGQLRVNSALVVDFFFLNVRARPFDDIRVRQALNYAIDRERVVDIYGGTDTAEPTCQLLPPQMPGFRRYCPYTRGPRRSGNWTGPDLRRAHRLIAASGTKGMPIGVWTTPRPQIGADQGRYLTGLLRRLGYRASLHLLEPDARFFDYTNDSRNRAQVISGGWSADYASPSAFISKMGCGFFAPGSASNTTNASEFCDPDLDRRATRAEALRATDPGGAYAAWARIDRELTDRAVWLPTVTPKTTDILSKRVGNYEYHPVWGVLVDQLWVR
jgi:peptide/nickel transport system substrate-binding protein